ncbi:type VI secretion system tube protein TssD [Terriglobus roseus]|uniref:Type VI secretion system secreted protein Hcp n=1 Tax=Terriglobus roseus TaxID=392734 RepID=A0A1H4JZ91_9BACT|nr:type VI secretion system tube protein TssD [Terriglobus roseus]SEB51610.1 type VI secretion system secreted protein Hcp [Terriglobus roseus]
MSLNAYLTVKGKKQGNFNGSVLQKGRENTIFVHSYTHDIALPLDANTGLPRGFRVHKPFIITKELDKSSPMFMQALCTNESLPQWNLQCSGPLLNAGIGGVGTEKTIYTIALTNASIVSIREYMSDNQNPTQTAINPREEISFAYQKIQWTWSEGSITASDDWTPPGV